MTLVLVTAVAGSGFKDSAVSGRTFPDVQGLAGASRSFQGGLDGTVRSGRPETCLSARMGLAFYRVKYAQHRRARGLETPYPAGRKPRNCADARYLAKAWRTRAFRQRKATERFLERQLPDVASWPHAVKIVQRVFPGTEGWLLSCSDAEGWNKGDNTLWQGYGGAPYSTWLRDSNTVGGPMQFRFGTFTGMYRAAYAHLRARGFRVHHHLSEWDSRSGLTTAWRSMVAQALAAGWARYTGEDNSHWSASWGRGC